MDQFLTRNKRVGRVGRVGRKSNAIAVIGTPVGAIHGVHFS
jgi:hypothetical protein